MKRNYLPIFLALLLAIPAVHARKRKTTRSVKPKTERVARIVERYDTLLPEGEEVMASGYDKPLRASYETLFFTNNTERTVSRLVFTLEYVDMQGRTIHQTSRSLRIMIPAGETRKGDFSSWDKQQSYYYKGSRRPRAEAVPYTIRHRIDTIFLVTPAE